MTLGTLNYWNYGIFLIMGDAGFISSSVEIESEIVNCTSRRLLIWHAQVDIIDGTEACDLAGRGHVPGLLQFGKGWVIVW